MNKQELGGILDDYESNNWDMLVFKDQLQVEHYNYGSDEISPPQSFIGESKEDLQNPLPLVLDTNYQAQLFLTNSAQQQFPYDKNEDIYKQFIMSGPMQSNPSNCSQKSNNSGIVYQMKQNSMVCRPSLPKSQSFQDCNVRMLMNQINSKVQSNSPVNQSIEQSQNLSINSCESFNRNIENCQLGHSSLNHFNEDSVLQRQNSTYDQEANSKKKRGRRKLEDNQYYAITNDKIQEWEYMLANSKNLSKKEKKILRNRISAQKSRNKKKEEFGTLNNQLETLRGKYTELFEIIEEILCDECKQNIFNNISHATAKRQKTSSKQPKTQASYSKPTFMKVLLAFVGVVSLVCLASYPFDYSPTQLSQQQYTDNVPLMTPRLLEEMLPLQNYLVFQINSLSQKSFNIMGLASEQVLDLKQRIQQIEGIPISAQKLYQDGQEMDNAYEISNLKEGQKLFLIIDQPSKMYTVSTFIKSGNKRYLDDSQVDIYVSYESSEPITLSRFKQIWGQLMGLKYKSDYVLTLNGSQLENDETIITENCNNDCEVQLLGYSDYIQIEDPAYTSVSTEHSHLLQKLMKITANEIMLEENMHVYRMKINPDNKHDNIFDVQPVNWQNRDEKRMFIIDNDENPVNEAMILFQKTDFNRFSLSTINCKETQNIPDLELQNHLHLIIPKNSNESTSLYNLPEFDCVIQPIREEL